MLTRTCAAPGCEATFTTYPSLDQRYCCKGCFRREWWRKRKASGKVGDGAYKADKMPSHPLAGASGIVSRSRRLLYDAIGPGWHECHWCKRAVRWLNARGRGARGGATALLVDHVDGNTRDNALDNLVPCCHRCNIKREHPNTIASGELFITKADGKKARAVERYCCTCGEKFLADRAQVAIGRGLYCSRSCARRVPHR